MIPREVKYNSRTILTTLSGEKVVRPQVDIHTACRHGDIVGTFTEAGVRAWNTGAEVSLSGEHFFPLFSRKMLSLVKF